MKVARSLAKAAPSLFEAAGQWVIGFSKGVLWYVSSPVRLYQERLLEVHQIEVSIETVRQLQVELGLWKSKRRQAARSFQRRERRGRCGKLIQIDGSSHDWSEGCGPRCTLIVFIDDATGRLVQGWFALSETTAIYLLVLRRHLEQYGRLVALYFNRHSIFRINPVALANGATTQ